MKRFIIAVLIGFCIFLIVFYIFLFTPIGNHIVKGIIESKLNSKIPVKVKVERFRLTISHFMIKIGVKNKSYVIASGKYSPFKRNIDANFEIKLIDLPKFEKIINYRLNGNIYTKGTCKGDKKLLDINGSANFADSNLNYNLKLKNFKLTDIVLNSKKIKIAKLLYFFNLPKYADGNLFINGKISKLTKGKIDIKISHGKALAKILNKEFNLNLTKNITFKGIIHNRLLNKKLMVNGAIFTSLANIKIPSLNVNLNNFSMDGDYVLTLFNLKKLDDLTQIKMRGKAVIKGKFAKSGELLNVTGNTKLFNGVINFTLKDNKFNLILKRVNTAKVLYTLYYPVMFVSIGDGLFNYEIKKEIGNFKFNFKDGRLIKKNLTFIPKTIVKIIKIFTGVDLTKELFKIVNLDGKINKKIIDANLYLKSRLAEIKSSNSIIDLNRETIKSLVNFKIGGVKFSILIAGKLNKPSIKLNPGKSILNRPELKELIEQKKNLEKNLKNKLKKLF